MKTFLSLMTLALLGAGCSSSSTSTATPEDLARAVVGYLASNDFDAYLAETVMTVDQGFAICPDAEEFKVVVDAFRGDFDDCRKAFDFTGATVTTVSPDLETVNAGFAGCGNTASFQMADEIDVTVTGPAGTYSFQLADSIETLEGWRQTDQIKCTNADSSSGS